MFLNKKLVSKTAPNLPKLQPQTISQKALGPNYRIGKLQHLLKYYINVNRPQKI